MKELLNIREICKDAKKVAISGHIRPDGDCIGSCLGLYLYLKKLLKKTKVDLYLEQPADIFADLKGYGDIQTTAEKEEIYDVFFVLDCNAERLGEAKKYFDSAKETVNIDHHISSFGSGTYNYVVQNASSASELVFDLLEEELLDADIAKALYTGIVHDTGVFQYTNTSPKTMRAAAKLMEFGFDFSGLIEKTFYEKTYIQNQIMGRTLLESILFMDGRCIVGVVEKKIMDFYKVEPKDLDGIVNQLRVIKGVDCAIFMYEVGVLKYKVSMRSNEKVDVAKIAGFYGGGGHKKAAGCTMNGTVHDVINNLSKSIEMQMNQEKS